MPILSFDDFINRIGGGFTLLEPYWGEVQTATTNVTTTGTQISAQRRGSMKAMPTLPSGVTGYIPTRISTEGLAGVLIAKLINLGSLSLATPTFTDGVAMPTVTELGVSRVMASAVLMEVTTGFNATPGSITVTYVDQDGNTAETTASMTLTVSAIAQSVNTVVLNAGDWGVRDITNATRTGGTTPTGVIQFWGLIPLSHMLPLGNPLGDSLLGAFPRIIKLGAGDVIGFFGWNQTATGAIFGDIYFVGDS